MIRAMDITSPEKLTKLVKMSAVFGKSWVINQVQAALLPHIMAVFTEHGHEDVERMILTDYDLVQQQTPPGVKQALNNLGSNEQFRQQWEGVVRQTVTPENIIEWMRNPEEWLDAEEAEEQRAELKRTADVIEETEGGRVWLEAQVLQVYRFANIIPGDAAPEDSTTTAAND